jgi:hypothetical protein
MSDTFDHEADAWDSLLDGRDDFDEDGGYWPREKKIVKCMYCGSTEVYWKTVPPNGRWCLHNTSNDKPHACER